MRFVDRLTRFEFDPLSGMCTQVRSDETIAEIIRLAIPVKGVAPLVGRHLPLEHRNLGHRYPQV